ncbi:MAG: trimethylamine methyltransferase family protein [Desulfobacterales bacterium]|nr:trimethylamine methyltransferase family protein [Desulfobacterales bacterium]
MKSGLNKIKGFGLNAFSEDDLDAIHYATLQVFRNTGIKVESVEALDIFEGAGAIVEHHNGYGIVKIPAHIVEDCIRWAPSTVTFFGRRPEDDYVADSSRIGFAPSYGENMNIIDPESRRIRPTVKQDVADIVRIADFLDEMVVIERPACSGDKMPETQPLHNFEAMVTNSSKHGFLALGSKENTAKIIEMAAACSGGMDNFRKRPIFTANVCPTSPLTLVQDGCEIIIECARSGIGMMIITMALAGATAPATMAGTLVQHNTEVLSALILAQLVKKGTPCTYSGCSTIMDMRLGSSPIGIPEQGMLSVAIAKMAQYYKLPSWVGGGASDSKLPDAQAAYDFSLNAMAAAMAGANIIYGPGTIESALTFDYAAFIMDAEQCSRIMKLVQAFEISEETMALDVIHDAGPAGEYMTKRHTMDHMRELSQAGLFDRASRERWEKNTGGKDLTERAYDKAAGILKTHQPLPLVEGAAEAMRNIIETYEAELKSEK